MVALVPGTHLLGHRPWGPGWTNLSWKTRGTLKTGGCGVKGDPAHKPRSFPAYFNGIDLGLLPAPHPPCRTPHPHPWSCGDTGTHNPKFPVGFTHRWSREARLALETLWRKKELRKTPQTHPTARPHSQTQPRAGPAGPVPLLGTLTWSPFSPALPGRPRSPLGPCREMGL